LRTTVVGRITLDDIDEHLQVIRRRRAEARPELIDVRDVDAGDLSPRALLLVAHRARFLIGSRAPARRAIVISTDAQAAFARRFAAFVAGWLRIGVFDDMDAAYEWARRPVWAERLRAASRVVL
jgi:hypothetical protein